MGAATRSMTMRSESPKFRTFLCFLGAPVTDNHCGIKDFPSRMNRRLILMWKCPVMRLALLKASKRLY